MRLVQIIWFLKERKKACIFNFKHQFTFELIFRHTVMIHVKMFLLNGNSLLCERVKAIKIAFSDALGKVDDVSNLSKHLISSAGSELGFTSYNFTVATVGPSVFLVMDSGMRGNIILEGLVIKLDTLTKLSAYTLAKMDFDENMLPKMLRGCIKEMKEFLKR